MDIEEVFSPIMNEQRQCPMPVKTARLSAFRAAKRSSGNGLNPLSRFPAAFSERRGKSFVRKQPAEKITLTKVLAPRSENAA
jgi:hypothetical protein